MASLTMNVIGAHGSMLFDQLEKKPQTSLCFSTNISERSRF